ncbi:MAG TPA: amidohydrolase family protein [Thermoanaerobaculia bacterium]|nr:amidohydrolase family protein [Thermoanaerobaculia bacterium]
MAAYDTIARMQLALAGGMIRIGSEVIDCTGLTITRGFWNSHVHFFERKWADAASIPRDELAQQLRDTYLRHGFTTVFDLGSPLENTQIIRERIESGEVDGPRILTTGAGVVPPGMMPSDIVLRIMGVMNFPAPETVPVDTTADGIKLFISDEQVAIAARTGKPVFVHPNNTSDVRSALRNGANVIAHTTPFSDPWDDVVLDRRVALTPTLALREFYARHDRISTRENVRRASIAQLQQWIAKGGLVLFGTDLGAVDPDPSPEYQLMSEAGMSFEQIVASLTTTPRDFFGIDTGADLTIFKRLDDVRYTIRNGRVIYRQR